MRKKEAIYTNTKCLTPPKQQLNQRPENAEIKDSPAPAPPWKIIAVILGIFCLILLGVSVALAIKHHSCPGCPDQWVRYRDSCYYFSNMKKDWNSSRNLCSAQDSGLLVISDTKEKNLFLGIHTEEHWIGLTNLSGSGWAWEDGSTLSDIKVTSNSPVQHCGVLLKGAFRASSCAVPFPCICEKSSK